MLAGLSPRARLPLAPAIFNTIEPEAPKQTRSLYYNILYKHTITPTPMYVYIHTSILHACIHACAGETRIQITLPRNAGLECEHNITLAYGTSSTFTFVTRPHVPKPSGERRNARREGGGGARELLGVEGGREVLVGLRSLRRRHLEGEGTGGVWHYSAHGGPNVSSQMRCGKRLTVGVGRNPIFTHARRL